MKPTELARYAPALYVKATVDKPTEEREHSLAREVRVYGTVELPHPTGRKRITRRSKKCNAIMAKHRAILRKLAV